MEQILQQHNPIILGDFNVHINDTDDSEAMDFTSTMSILGLDQHVNFTTHNKGNILDPVFSPHLTQVNILKTVQGPFFSDHCAIICSLGLMRNKLERKMVSSHRIKSIIIWTCSSRYVTCSGHLRIEVCSGFGQGLSFSVYHPVGCLCTNQRITADYTQTQTLVQLGN